MQVYGNELMQSLIDDAKIDETNSSVDSGINEQNSNATDVNKDFNQDSNVKQNEDVQSDSSETKDKRSESEASLKDAVIDSDNKKEKNKKKKYSKEEKTKHAFSKLKNKLKSKHKEEINKLRAEIESLKKRESEKIDKNSFETDEEYLNAFTQNRFEELANSQKLESASEQLRQKEYQANQNKIKRFYSDEKSYNEYVKTWETGQQNGALEAISNDAVITEFLRESDYSPKLIEHFVKRVDVLDDYLNMSDRRKQFELYNLEKRLEAFLLSQDNVSSQKQNTSARKRIVFKRSERAKNPVIGSVTKNVKSVNKNGDWSDEDYINFVRNSR